ncbi:hypothetical protein E2986_05634 [Frieseomelitta varia]|uniref:Ig-like domain-containing protein n=1 Tax=Frieseomelitta varia TaxID=561572 RepID=A0A833RZS6_9HYME|nr:hypothetical protein E2986_05634 [Frieseomelitta varia]
MAELEANKCGSISKLIASVQRRKYTVESGSLEYRLTGKFRSRRETGIILEWKTWKTFIRFHLKFLSPALRPIQPMIWIENQLVGAYEGQTLVLECHSEAYPTAITYWTRPSNETITNGSFLKPPKNIQQTIVEKLKNSSSIKKTTIRFMYQISVYVMTSFCAFKLGTASFSLENLRTQNYKVETIPKGYEINMRLTIKSVQPQDFGSYRCVAKNSLGEMDGKIKLYKKHCVKAQRYNC